MYATSYFTRLTPEGKVEWTREIRWKSDPSVSGGLVTKSKLENQNFNENPFTVEPEI